MNPTCINHHHLHHFWAVARDGNLTRTARRLQVAQSAVSSQIRQLEAQLGEALFERQGRRLVLTEAGRIALDYADEIFAASGELLATIQSGRRRDQVLSVGAVATLSRNFQESFISPLLEPSQTRLRLQSGSLDDLLGRLAEHALDVVLSNQRPQREGEHDWRLRRIARQPVSLVGHQRREAFAFPRDVAEVPLIVPGPENDIRTEFDALCEQLGIVPRIVAEVDDMAMMRLLARDADATALLPSVVVRDELGEGVLYEHCVVPGLFETFYAVTIARQYPHPLLQELFARDEEDILSAGNRSV